MPSAQTVSLSNTKKAATVIFMTELCVIIFVVFAWANMNVQADTFIRSLIVWYLVGFILISVPFVIVLMDSLNLVPNLDRRVLILRLLLYVAGIGSMALLTILATYSGGIFESQFSWIFEVIIVLSLILVRYAPPSGHHDAPPLDHGDAPPSEHRGYYVVFVTITWIFTSYICSELWPLATPDRIFWSPPYLKFVEWLHAIFAVLIIVLISFASDKLDRPSKQDEGE
jgi:hypothetical protein